MFIPVNVCRSNTVFVNCLMQKIVRNSYIFGNDYLLAGIETGIFNTVYAKQKQANLCWAASIEMALKYYGLDISQDEFAAELCGVDIWGNACDCPGPTDIITKNLNRCYVTHCLNSQSNSGTPNAAYLFQLLKDNKPVIVGYHTGGSVGHAVLVTAVTYERTVFGDIPFSITVRDPDPDPMNQLRYGKKTYRISEFLPLIYHWWVPSVKKHAIPRLQNAWSQHAFYY